MKIPDTDILHSGCLENLQDYKIFRRRYPYRVTLPSRTLTDWYLQEMPSNEHDENVKISLVGVCNGAIIRTSPVTSIISARKVCTQNCIYLLEMPSKVLDNPLKGVEKHFVYGFPSNWEIILNEAFKSSTIQNDTENSSFKAKEHSEEKIPDVKSQVYGELIKECKKDTIEDLNNLSINKDSIKEIREIDRLDTMKRNSLASQDNSIIKNPHQLNQLDNEIFNKIDLPIEQAPVQENSSVKSNKKIDSDEVKHQAESSLKDQTKDPENCVNILQNAENLQDKEKTDIKTHPSIIEKINSLFYSALNQCDTNSDSLDYDESLLDGTTRRKSADYSGINSKSKKSLSLKSAENSNVSIKAKFAQNRRKSEPLNVRENSNDKKALTVEEFMNINSPFKSPKNSLSSSSIQQNTSLIHTENEKVDICSTNLNDSSAHQILPREPAKLLENSVLNDSKIGSCNLNEDVTKRDSVNFSKIDQDLFSTSRKSVSSIQDNESMCSQKELICNHSNQIPENNISFKDKILNEETDKSIPNSEMTAPSQYPQVNQLENIYLVTKQIESNGSEIFETEKALKSKSHDMLDEVIFESNKLTPTDLPISDSNEPKNNILSDISHDLKSDYCEEDKKVVNDLNSGALQSSQHLSFGLESENLEDLNDLPVQLVNQENQIMQNVFDHNDSLMALCDDDTINPVVSKANISEEHISDNKEDSNSELNINLSFASSHSFSTSSKSKRKSVKKLKIFKKSIPNPKIDLKETSNLANIEDEFCNDQSNETSDQVLKKIKSSSFIKIIDNSNDKSPTPSDVQAVSNEKNASKKISIKLSRNTSLDTETPTLKKAIENLPVNLDDTLISNLDELSNEEQKVFDDLEQEHIIKSFNIDENSTVPVKIVTSLETDEHQDDTTSVVKLMSNSKPKKKRTALKLPAYFKGKPRKIIKK